MMGHAWIWMAVKNWLRSSSRLAVRGPQLFTILYSLFEQKTYNLLSFTIFKYHFSVNFRVSVKGTQITWSHQGSRVAFKSCLGEVTIFRYNLTIFSKFLQSCTGFLGVTGSSVDSSTARPSKRPRFWLVIRVAT